VVLGITFLSLIIGELVPKRLALAAPERFACLLAGPMRLLSMVSRPAVRLLGWTTDLVLRVIGAQPEATSSVTGEKVRLLMQEGQQAGVFHQTEPEMVEHVLDLDVLLVKEIMTPRPKVMFVNQDDPHELVWHKIVASRHSYFPVYRVDRDHVVGIVSVKSIYANLAAGAVVHLDALMTEPLFVPATQSVVQLLESFRQSRKHFAIVADEPVRSVLVLVLLAGHLALAVGRAAGAGRRLLGGGASGEATEEQRSAGKEGKEFHVVFLSRVYAVSAS
jgi:putative hemolysin